MRKMKGNIQNMSNRETRESERKQKEAFKSFKDPVYPYKAFAFNVSWNTVVLFHLHLLPAAVAVACICCDTVYQLGYTPSSTWLQWGGKTVWDRKRERERESRRVRPSGQLINSDSRKNTFIESCPPPRCPCSLNRFTFKLNKVEF